MAGQEERKAAFKTADTNDDGILDAAEWRNFHKMNVQSGNAKNGMEVCAYSDEFAGKIYAFLNKVTPDVEGISPFDMMNSKFMPSLQDALRNELC